MFEYEKIDQINLLSQGLTNDNVGDRLLRALENYKTIKNINIRQQSEVYLSQIRFFASQVTIGWKSFNESPSNDKKFKNDQLRQLVTLAGILQSFLYGFDRLNEVTLKTHEHSAPVHFYINSLYHHIAALFLLDKNDDPMGGMIYKTLEPMGLAYLLDPIKEILETSVSDEFSFGEMIRKFRNQFLVHGKFSPDNIYNVIEGVELYQDDQLEEISNYLWMIFNTTMILYLQIYSILTEENANVDELLKEFLEQKRNTE